MLEPEKVVNEGGARVTVTSNSDTLIHAVSVVGNDVVQLVRHATRLGDVGNRTLAVELGGDDVVHHTTGVANFEAARLDATNSSGTDDGDTLLLRKVGNLTGTLDRR
jgi:hypothetical protein